MRTLLVCTDFSGPAYHAARYAVVLAQQYNIPNITLFHAYRRFALATAMPPHPDEEAEQVKAINFQLHEQKQNLQATIPIKKTQVLIRAEKLSLTENINQLCEEENADMVIMGVTNRSAVERGFAGSTMVDVIRNSNFPVCVVPEAAVLAPVTNVLFAWNSKHILSPAALARLDLTLALLKAKVTILTVEKRNLHIKHDAGDAGQSLLKELDKHKPVHKRVEGDDVAENIFHYVESQHISMIVAMPEYYNLLEGIFHHSTTQQLIYQSMVPVLTLHE
jgi:nucleotide-binding universal stress UspA family protein